MEKKKTTPQMHRDGGDSWRLRSYVAAAGRSDHLCANFTWPPRSYSCSFCRREFRSAQALGGHMNVHRRDRARLRQSPPWDPPPSSSNPNPNPNPNAAVMTTNVGVPNLNMPPPPDNAKQYSPVMYTFRSLLAPLAAKALRGGVGEWGRVLEEEEGETEGIDDEMVRRRKEKNIPVVRLRLDLAAAACGDFEDSLDLELRLGYP